MRKLLLAAALFWSVSGLANVEPVLAPDKATLAKIKALRPNQAVRLGNAAVVGDFNAVARRFKLQKTGPTRRNYSIKMVWMPERERALYLGANHAVPHRLNDVWEFDLSALSWVLLYAPDNPRGHRDLGDMSDVEFKDGILVTKRGGPAVIGHVWWGLTYDPVRREALFINTWGTEKRKAIEKLGGDPAELYRGPPLWAFSPESRQWRSIKTGKPWPQTPYGGMLEYVPQYEGAIWHANHFKMRATWLYDPAENSWRDLGANAGRDLAEASPKTDQVAYYDPRRHAVIAQSGVRTHRFDVQRRQWSKVLSGEKGQAPRGHDSFGAMVLDPDSGHGLLLDMQDNTLWAFDPDGPAWTRLNPTGDPLPTGQNSLTYFDPAHGVFVVIEGTKVWAYRYQAPSPKP